MEFPKITLDAKIKEVKMCFGCGRNNPIGLKLDFKKSGKAVHAEFIPNQNHEGWPGFVHGGILLAVLDEAFGWASLRAGFSVTARVQARLRNMAKTGEQLMVTGTIINVNKRLIDCKAEICRQDGTVVAEGTSTQFIINRGKDTGVR